MSDLATRVVNDARQARQSIHQQDKQAALNKVDDALKAAKEVKQKSHGRTEIPVYQEIETVTLWQPQEILENGRTIPLSGTRARTVDKTTNAQSNPAQNSQTSNAETGTANNGGASQNSATSTPAPAVAQVAGAVTSIIVDMNDAERHLKEAHDALSKKTDYNLADSTLAAIQGDVHTTSYAADLPLVRVRENLVLAKKRAQTSDWAGTQNALKAASDALGNYASISGNPHTSDAQTLKQNIDSYAANVNQQNSDAVNQIQGWWNTTTDWVNATPQQASAKH